MTVPASLGVRTIDRVVETAICRLTIVVAMATPVIGNDARVTIEVREITAMEEVCGMIVTKGGGAVMNVVVEMAMTEPAAIVSIGIGLIGSSTVPIGTVRTVMTATAMTVTTEMVATAVTTGIAGTAGTVGTATMVGMTEIIETAETIAIGVTVVTNEAKPRRTITVLPI